MNWTKNHTYIALGVVAVAGLVLWLNKDKKEKSAMKPDAKNTLSEKDANSTFSTFSQNEIGRMSGYNPIFKSRGAFDDAQQAKKSFCDSHPENYNCRSAKSGGTLLAK